MNLNDLPFGYQVSIDTLSALLFVKINGPLPDALTPLSYVENWLQCRHHTSTDAATGKRNNKTKPVLM